MILLQRSSQFSSLTISMTGIQRRNIGVGQNLILRKFGVQPIDDRLTVAVKHPKRQAKRPHILTAQRVFVAHAKRLDGFQRQRADVERQHLPFRKAAIFKRVAGIFGLIQVTLVKLACVRDNQTAFAQRPDICFQRSGVHRDQHVRLITRGVDCRRTKVNLKRRNTEKRPDWRTDFGRKIRECRKVIARQCRRQRKLSPGQLHAVAAVPGKAHNDCLALHWSMSARLFVFECRSHAF